MSPRHSTTSFPIDRKESALVAIDTSAYWKSLCQTASPAKLAHFREAIIEHAYRYRLSEGDTAVDVGAHRARHTVPMAQTVGLRGTVFAIEAAPEMQKKLRAQINHCGVDGIRKIVTYLDYALSDKEGEAEFFYFPRQGSGLSSLSEPTNTPDNAEVVVEKVPLRRLDDLIDAGTQVRFIKADIEGAEYHAFCGAKGIISGARPMIAFEHQARRDAERFGYSEQDFFSLWRELDYSLISVFGREITPANWGEPNAHDIFAVPNEEKDAHREIVSLSIIRAIEDLLQAEDGA